MCRPNVDTFRGMFGFPGQNRNESLHKTVVMCCQILDRKSVAPSSGDFGGHRRSGRPVDNIGNFEKKTLSIKLL